MQYQTGLKPINIYIYYSPSLPYLVAEVEAMAAVQALVFPKDIGTNSIILERDSKVIIDTLKDKDESLASFGLPISDAKFLIEAFRNISYAHIPRCDKW